MRGLSLGDRVRWRRVKDYVAKYQPFIIGGAGVSQVELTRQAIAAALGDDRAVAVPRQQRSGHRSVANGILGVAETTTLSWWQLLGRSLVRETLEEEPDTIIASLYPHRPGQVDWLIQQLPFQMVVATDVQSVHLDYFHDQTTVAHELMSATVALPAEALLVLNNDDPFVSEMASKAAAQQFRYSASGEADVMAERFDRLPARKTGRPRGGFAGEVRVHTKALELHLPQLVGRWQLSAMLAGLQAAHLLGTDLKAAAGRLQNLSVPPRHLVKRQGQRQAAVFDHTAAVAPEVILADLATLRALSSQASQQQRTVAVIHELPGLAGMSDRWHRRLGQQAGQTAQIVVGIGRQARALVAEAMQAGADAHHFDTVSEAGKWLPDSIRRGDAVLLAAGGATLSDVL